MKQHPVAGVRQLEQHDIRDKTNDLISAVRSDLGSTTGWLDLQLEWYKRRFSQVDRYSRQPWAGGSTVWLSLSDVFCTQLGGSYYNALFGGAQTVAMRARNADAFDTAQTSEKVANELFRPGGPHAMPDLRRQANLNIADTLIGGRGRLKIDYAYETRTVTKVLRKGDMPGILGILSIVPEMSDKERDAARQNFPQLNPPELQAAFGEPANPMNKKAFKQHAKTIEAIVIDLWNLDPEEKVDKVTLKEIMAFLKSGSDTAEVTVKSKAVIQDGPRITSVPCHHLIVPPGTKELHTAERLTERLFFTENEIRQRAEDHVWVHNALEKAVEGGVVSGPQANDEFAQVFEEQAQTYGAMRHDDLIEVWEVYHHEDIDGDGLAEPVVTTVEPNSGATLKKIELPFDHGQFPYVATMFEEHSPLYHMARGVPEILSDVEEHANGWFRLLEDNMLIGTNLSFTYNKNSFNNFEEISWQPGVGLARDDPDDITQLPMAPHDIAIERLLAYLMPWAERLVGGIDDQAPDDENFDRPRTATQNLIMDSGRKRLKGHRVETWMEGWGVAFRQAWQNFRQFGPDEFYISVAGSAPQKLSRYQIRGEFDIVPVGAVGGMDPAQRVQTAQQMLMMAMQMQGAMDQDIRHVQDPVAAYVHAMRLMDPLLADKMIQTRPPEEQQKLLQQQQELAQRAAMLEDAVARETQNAGITPEEQHAIAEEDTKASAYKKRQVLVDEARAKQGVAARNAAIAANGG